MAIGKLHEFADVSIGVENLAFGTPGAEHPFATGIDLELVLRPFRNPTDSGVGAKTVGFFAVIEDRDLDLAAAVAVQNFGPVGMAFVKLCMFWDLFLGFLDKNREKFRLQVLSMRVFGAEPSEKFTNSFIVANFQRVWPASVLDLDMDFVFLVHGMLSALQKPGSSRTEERILRPFTHIRSIFKRFCELFSQKLIIWERSLG